MNKEIILINEKNLSSDPVQRLGELLALGVQARYLACKLYVEIIDKTPSDKEIIHDKYSFISESDWNKIESVGRGIITPKLLEGGFAANALSRCSRSDQDRYIKEPIELLIQKAPNQFDTIKVMYYNLDKNQRKQIFRGGHVNTLAEQKNYLVSGEAEKNFLHIGNGKPYAIRGGKLIVTKPCVFTLKELTIMTIEMAGKK